MKHLQANQDKYYSLWIKQMELARDTKSHFKEQTTLELNRYVYRQLNYQMYKILLNIEANLSEL